MSIAIKTFMYKPPSVSQIRVVALDSEDNVTEVVWQSEKFNPPVYSFDNEWYEGLKYTSSVYDMTDYENIPELEFQILVDNEWKYYSNVVNDYYNL